MLKYIAVVISGLFTILVKSSENKVKNHEQTEKGNFTKTTKCILKTLGLPESGICID